MAKTILVLGGLLPDELAHLESAFKVIRLPREPNPEAVLAEHRNDIVGIVATPLKRVNKTLMQAFPNLEIISQFGIGVDNIDFEAAAAQGIVVTNTPGLVTSDTADIALALMLGVARRTTEGDAYIRVGKWYGGHMGLGVSLTGKTVGILGLGRIGQAVACRAAAFEMKVVYNGRREKPDQPYRYYPDLEAMAQDSNFLVLCCAGGEETRHLVNAAVLKALGPKGYLINVARGSVVDESALLVALRNKAIAGAGLDVYEDEPNVPEALMKMDNVVLLPHIGTATVETRTKMGQLVVENLLAHFDGKPLKTPVAA